MRALYVPPYKVQVFHDGVYTAPITDLFHARGDGARAEAIVRWGRPDFSVDVNCFGLHGPGGLTLIDAGAGEHWGPAYGKAVAAMADAGFSTENVETVLLTHAHGDHAYGLLQGESASFPNAVVRMPRGDMDWYGDAGNEALTPQGKRGGFKIVDLLRRAYGERLETFDTGPVMPGIEAIALPGHTPGHTGFLVHSDDRKLLLWGDVVHLDGLQFADPEIFSGYDLDPEAGLKSRRTALEEASRQGWYVGGGHVSGIRRVERVANGFAFVDGEPDPVPA